MNQETTPSSKQFSVLVIDMARYREAGSEILISGFPNREVAIEYARRRLRASIEELRSANQTDENLRQLWAIYGEDILVIGENYTASSELAQFIAHRATQDECDWSALEKQLGAQLHKRVAD